MSKELTIDRETADRITYLNLVDYRKYLKKALRDHKKGGWLHPEDVGNNIRLIEALDLIIKYFGEE